MRGGEAVALGVNNASPLARCSSMPAVPTISSAGTTHCSIGRFGREWWQNCGVICAAHPQPTCHHSHRGSCRRHPGRVRFQGAVPIRDSPATRISVFVALRASNNQFSGRGAPLIFSTVYSTQRIYRDCSRIVTTSLTARASSSKLNLHDNLARLFMDNLEARMVRWRDLEVKQGTWQRTCELACMMK